MLALIMLLRIIRIFPKVLHKAMKYLEKTKTYNNKFSIYTNPRFTHYIFAQNRNIIFEGIDGINFIQLYSLELV